MGWGNSQRRRGVAPRHYKLPPPGPRPRIRQTGVVYGDGSPAEGDGSSVAEQWPARPREYKTPPRVMVFSLDGELLKETAIALTPGDREDDTIVVRIPGPSPDSTSDELAGYYTRVRRRLEHGVHVPERGLFHLKRAADDPHAPISGDVPLTRADRQRYKIPVYNLTTGQPLPDVTGEGAVTVNFDNSAFHSLFPEAELITVRVPKPPDRATEEEIAEHQARMRELVEEGININGQRYYLVLATGARKHGDFLFAHTPYWKKIAPTFEKIMAYGGIMLTSCREPPRQFKHLRVLIVAEDGEYGTGDCDAKMADWLFEEFGQQGRRFRAGQFRLLAEREDGSGMVVVGKGTIKRMDHQDVDERG
jgi:hypothetical protein